MKVFVFDAEKCNGCYGCQVACKDEHVGNEWLPFAKPQPDTGHFWCKVTEIEHGQIPKVRIEYTPHLCHHCGDAPCMKAFPDEIYRTADGMVIIDPVKAAGKKEIAEACPYGAIYWNEEFSLAQKCTGCAHLLEEGELPRCVDVCAVEALRFGEYEEFAEEIKGAELLADAADDPHVYYLNMPHLFIGGEVWDPVDDEIIEGAKIVLTDAAGAAVAQTETDGFGDFWFKRLLPGAYHLDISAAGFKGVSQDVDLQKSLNVGDFPLERA